MEENNSCTYRQGPLPECAPLALAYTPMQQEACPTFEAAQALIKGTLFPGLELPFMNVVNTKNLDGTPLGELQAMAFVCQELKLYLDTHPDDMEAFNTLKGMISMTKEAQEVYARKYGPISFSDLACADSYTWINSPWPWEYMQNGGEA